MSNQQPEALRLAAQLKDRFGATVPTSQAAAKLIHQHAEIERLRAELAALQEDLRCVAHSGMGSCAKVHAAPAGWRLVPVEPTLDAIAGDGSYIDAVDHEIGRLLATLIAIESAFTQKCTDTWCTSRNAETLETARAAIAAAGGKVSRNTEPER